MDKWLDHLTDDSELIFGIPSGALIIVGILGSCAIAEATRFFFSFLEPLGNSIKSNSIYCFLYLCSASYEPFRFFSGAIKKEKKKLYWIGI